MMKLVDITQKYGSATYAYPFAPYEVPQNYRGKPQYEFDFCIGCAACGIACPPNAITVAFNENKDKLVWRFDCSRCIFCGRCDEVCPTGAIKLSEEFELAIKFDKSALIQEGQLDTHYCENCQKPYTAKRLIKYAIKKLEKANLLEGRLEDAKEYVKLCPTCKKLRTIEKLTKNEEMRVK